MTMRATFRQFMATVMLCLVMPSTSDAYFLNHALGDNSYNGKTPTHTTGSNGPWQTVAKANASLPSDSTIYIAANDTLLGNSVNPTGLRTTWIGDSTNARAVKFPGANLVTTGHTFIGVSFWGGVTCDDSQFRNGRSQYFRKCGIYGQLYSRSGPQSFDYCEIGSSNVPTYSYIKINPDFSNGDSVRFDHCTMYLRDPILTAGDFLLQFQPVRYGGMSDTRTMNGWSVTANTCTLQYVSHIDKIMMWNRWTGSTIRGNTFLWRDSTGSTSGSTQAFCVRDSFSRNVIDSNTFVFQSQIPNTGQLCSEIYSSGNQWPDSGNVWRDNLFKSDVAVPGGSANAAWQFQWQLGGRDSILRNTFVSGTNLATAYFGNVKPGDSSFVRKNFFANLAGGAALKIEVSACPNATYGCGAVGDPIWGPNSIADMQGNIFYAPRSYDGALQMTYPPASVGSIFTDYNLFWHPTDRGRADFIGPFGASRSPWPIGTHPTFDTHSVYGCPVILDSTYATFDPTIACNSAAIASGRYGTDMGPKAYNSSLCAPSPITDLRVIGETSNEAVLTWTAPGTRGNVGQAQLYSIRYNTSPITSLNFASSDTLAFPDAYYPKTAGEPEISTVPGLTAGVTYYFAIKTLGAEGIYSGLSNVASVTTRRAGTFGGHLDP